MCHNMIGKRMALENDIYRLALEIKKQRQLVLNQEEQDPVIWDQFSTHECRTLTNLWTFRYCVWKVKFVKYIYIINWIERKIGKI